MMIIIGSKCHGRVMVTGRWELSDSQWDWVSFTKHLCNCNDLMMYLQLAALAEACPLCSAILVGNHIDGPVRAAGL